MQHQSKTFSGMLREAMLMLMVFIGCANANAVTWTPIQLDQEVQVKAFQDAFYSITPTESGVMKLVTVSGAGTNGYAVTNTGSPVTDGSVETSWSWATDKEPSYLSFAVTAGTTYYISLNFPMDSWTFKATMNSGDFSFTSSDPADGSMFYITSNETAYLYFTSNSVSFSEGELTVNGNVVKIYNYRDYNDLVAKGIFSYHEEGSSGIVNWNGAICARSENENGIAISFTSATGTGYFNVLNRLYEQGKLKDNDPIKLTIHGIKDNLTGKVLNGDGNIELTWYFGGAPTVLTGAKMPEVLKSWFNVGDPGALASFTFSRNIKSARAYLEMGMGEGMDDLYTEEIDTEKISYDGKTVIVDLSDKMRTKKTMGLKYDWDSFTLQLFNVVDEDGNDTFSEDLGSASSYSYTVPYKDISTEVSSEFTPKSGTTLSADTKEVEIWFNNSNVLFWDGVAFTYYTVENVEDVDNEGNTVTTEQNVAHEVLISKENLTIEEEDNETTVIVPVPADIYKANNIRVALNVTGSVDGTHHVIAAYYNTTLSHDLDLVQYAEPANESTVSILNEIYLNLGFTHAINKKIENPVKVYGKTTGKTVTGYLESDGMTNVKIVLSEDLTEADTYDVQIAAGVIGDYIYGESSFKTGITNEQCTLTYTVDGKFAGKNVSIDPEEGEVKVLDKFTLTFFAYNSVNPSWNNDAQPYVENADGEKVYGNFQEKIFDYVPNQVTVELTSPIKVPGEYKLVIPAGAVCNGANGEPFTIEYTFAYTVVESPVAPEKPVVDPVEGTYDEIADILIDFGQPVTIVEPSEDNNYWVPMPNIEDTEGGWAVYAGGILETTDNPNVLKWVQDGTVVKGCNVVFTIPAGCVKYADGSVNADYKYNYTITGNNYKEPEVKEGGDPTITPEEGTVTALQNFTVIFTDWGGFLGTEEYPTIKNAQGEVVATAWNGLEMDWDDWSNPSKAFINFEEPVTAEGDYTLVVPVTLNDVTWTLFVDKVYEFHYTIATATTLAGIIDAQGGKADIYNINGQLVKKAAGAQDVKTLTPGLYIVNGRKTLVK